MNEDEVKQMMRDAIDQNPDDGADEKNTCFM